MKGTFCLLSLVMWAGVSGGTVRYKCNGEWVDYWPCDKELADNRAATNTAIQAMKDQFSARASKPFTGDVESQLVAYFNTVEASTNNAVNFHSLAKTTMHAYKSIFTTSAVELMTNENPSPNSSELFVNQFMTELWQKNLCTPELRSIMANFGLDLVSGDLQDNSGETQSFALCSRRAL